MNNVFYCKIIQTRYSSNNLQTVLPKFAKYNVITHDTFPPITNHALVNYKQIIGLEMYCNILATAKWVVLGTTFILNCRKCAMCIHF